MKVHFLTVDRGHAPPRIIIPLPRLVTALWISLAMMTAAAFISAYQCGQYRDAYERLNSTHFIYANPK